MDIHKPKPWHGLREFLKEYGIIVLGVLTALAFEQGLASLHERQVAGDARRNVRAETEIDLSFIKDRVRAQSCIDRRLDEIADLLARSGDGPLSPPPRWLGHPGVSPMFLERWRAATASGRNSLFSEDEQAGFDNLYGLFARYEDHQAREQQMWSELRALETWRGPLGPQARLAFTQALQQARYEAWDLKYASTFALDAGAKLGLKAQAGSGPASACLPIDTPRDEAVRRLRSPFGAP